MNVMLQEGSMAGYKIWTKEVEEAAMVQIKNTADLPFIHKHIAIMPDVHAGYGCTIGSVIPTYKAIIPSAVGVDIGCGMAAYRTNLRASDLPDDLSKIRSNIEAVVPVGFNIRNKESKGVRDLKITDQQNDIFDHYNIKFNQKHAKQLGTLGGGNHFIELCIDQNQDVWVMLHSGSRGIGNLIGTTFIDIAKEEMITWFIDLPDKDLSYLPDNSRHFDPYIKSMLWAQDYARMNRDVMLEEVFNILNKHFKNVKLNMEAINCHHNYAEMENHYNKNVWIARKGAVRARKGDMGIIPGSMGTKSYIVRGLGEKTSFNSCSHGAGRVMSRAQARKQFTVEDHIKATQGVNCRKDEGVIDETPLAYKDIDVVMENQKDLVEIVHTLKQVMCIKG